MNGPHLSATSQAMARTELRAELVPMDIGSPRGRSRRECVEGLDSGLRTIAQQSTESLHGARRSSLVVADYFPGPLAHAAS